MKNCDLTILDKFLLIDIHASISFFLIFDSF